MLLRPESPHGVAVRGDVARRHDAHGKQMLIRFRLWRKIEDKRLLRVHFRSGDDSFRHQLACAAAPVQ